MLGVLSAAGSFISLLFSPLCSTNSDIFQSQDSQGCHFTTGESQWSEGASFISTAGQASRATSQLTRAFTVMPTAMQQFNGFSDTVKALDEGYLLHCGRAFFFLSFRSWRRPHHMRHLKADLKQKALENSAWGTIMLRAVNN